MIFDEDQNFLQLQNNEIDGFDFWFFFFQQYKYKYKYKYCTKKKKEIKPVHHTKILDIAAATSFGKVV
jgi:hypothetical protein